jgi:hypothetical protein
LFNSNSSICKEDDLLLQNLLNYNFSEYGISEQQAYSLWHESFSREIKHLDTYTEPHLENQTTYLWHLEGYLYDVMHSLSYIPEAFYESSYVQQMTEIVGVLPKYLSEHVMRNLNSSQSLVGDDVHKEETHYFFQEKLNYLMRLVLFMKHKAELWSSELKA